MHDGLKFGSTCTVGTSTSEEKQCQAIQRRRMQLNLYETNSNCGDDTFLALLKTNGSTRSVAITIIYSTVCWGCFDSFFCFVLVAAFFPAEKLSILPFTDIISNTSALVWRISCLVVYMVWNLLDYTCIGTHQYHICLHVVFASGDVRFDLATRDLPTDAKLSLIWNDNVNRRHEFFRGVKNE